MNAITASIVRRVFALLKVRTVSTSIVRCCDFFTFALDKSLGIR